MLLAIHNGENGVGEPVTNINIPMMGFEENYNLNMSDIYPSLCSLPTDWVNSFSLLYNGRLFPTDHEGAHTPTTNIIDTTQFIRLFGNKLIFSYFGMPQYFRSVINSLYAAATELSNKSEQEFTLNDPSYYNYYGNIEPNPWKFPTNASLANHEWLQGGKITHRCKVLSPSESLKVLTGFDNYHDGSDEANEYRSLTELNSVINLVPLRTTAATYWLDDHSYREVYSEGAGYRKEIDDWTQRSFKIASHMYSDLAINISNIQEGQDAPQSTQVTIAGEVKIKNIITDVSTYHWHHTIREPNLPISQDDWTEDKVPTEYIYGPSESILKYAHILIEINNKFSWDKVWLDAGESESDETWEDEFEDTTPGGSVGGDHGGLIPLPSDHELTVPFTKTFTLSPGCNVIRVRIIGRNHHVITQDKSVMIHPRLWWPYSMYWWKWWANLLGYPPWMYVYPRRTLYTGWENDPSMTVDMIEWSNIEASYTITGDNFDPIMCDVSI